MIKSERIEVELEAMYKAECDYCKKFGLQPEKETYKATLEMHKAVQEIIEKFPVYNAEKAFGWLARLYKGEYIAPITDEKSEWKLEKKCKDYAVYRSKRLNTLKKEVFNGKTKYSDTRRVRAINLESNSNISFFSPIASYFMNKALPIKMPYYPSSKPITVYIREFLTDRKNGDFDTISLEYAILPNGKKLLIDKHYKDIETELVEIPLDELQQRKRMHYERIRKETMEK